MDISGAMISNGYFHVIVSDNLTIHQDDNAIGAGGVMTNQEMPIKLIDHLKFNMNHCDMTTGGVPKQDNSVRKVDRDQSKADQMKDTPQCHRT